MDNNMKLRSSDQSPESQPFKRSSNRSSFRASFKASKQKLDNFLRSPSFDFRRKRKHYFEAAQDDAVSVRSENSEEPSRKRRSSIAKMAHFLTPLKSMKKVTDAFQKSFSTYNLQSPTRQQHGSLPYRRPPASATVSPRRRLSTAYWHETIDRSGVSQLNKMQLDRQEAIFELYKSEMDLIDDLLMIKATYHESMLKLCLMSGEELDNIFGHLYRLQPVHEDLVAALRDQRLPDGTTNNIGHVLVEWAPKLEAYITYCGNQVYVKSLLDSKKMDPAIDDFLDRCQESPFSRRLDLWSFLDVPRSRLVKYPLLFKNIQKHTPAHHEDHSLLDETVKIVEDIITKVDTKTGQSKCQFAVGRLEFMDDRQRLPQIQESQFILCEGVLRNSRGFKLQVFLFDRVFLMTRSVTHSEQQRYQVYHQPIPVDDLVVRDRAHAAPVRRGSFRNAFTQSANNTFYVSSKSATSHSYTLIANDELDKRHWLQQLNIAISSSPTVVHSEHTSTGGTVDGRRRSGRHRKRDSWGSEDADTSLISVNSLTSLMSVFSSNSSSTVASDYSSNSVASASVSKVKEVDTDSGIVT